MIYIGADHAGFKLKEYVIDYIKSLNRDITDEGAFALTPGDDYPDYAEKVCKQIHPGDMGILICDTGIGMSIAANRHLDIRAALCSSIFDALRAKEHNNANILVLGAETTDIDTVKAMVKVFLDTPFSNGERHIRRLEKIS